MEMLAKLLARRALPRPKEREARDSYRSQGHRWDCPSSQDCFGEGGKERWRLGMGPRDRHDINKHRKVEDIA